MALHGTQIRPDQHLLDRPIWSALTSCQGDLAVVTGSARAYPSDVAQFVATDPRCPDARRDLARLMRLRRDGLTLMQANAIVRPHGVHCTRRADGVQMVLEDAAEIAPFPGAQLLSAADVGEMHRLVERTEPGPFFPHTMTLGRYWGIRLHGHLVAMAGERMKLSGFTEISAVCVHPLCRGQGLARGLVAQVALDILQNGGRPFLHAYADNEPAISLYRSMGFKIRSMMHIETLVADENVSPQ